MTKRENILKRYTTLAGAIDLLVEGRVSLLDPSSWKDTNDTQFLRAYCNEVDKKSLYAACFTQEPETYHHWQVFAGTNEGVCIELDRAALLSSLTDPNYFWGDVEYLTLDGIAKLDNVDAFRLPFMKRKGYIDEGEFRLLYQSDEEQKAVHCFDIERSWIKRIVLNPWMPDSLAKSVKKALGSIPDCKPIRIVRTTLIDNAQWKSACNRVDQFTTLQGSPPRQI
ncbi:hypothetical protein IFT54_05610 [Sphingomonas sp. CFBP 13714]|uniref:hypothetical protein n=1 Tax=Sphingomonas sp. CFBP 13714 TaxID=2775308 RepID=UPI001786CAFE|nr:hypothetical protein [Sphingomonas sp. CFBP 13714]MBD8699291.1 hypothetical protein [Sphingomonas sp. CFBP 13714]